MEITEVEEVSKGIGYDYEKWQRKPPAYKVYKVNTSKGLAVLRIYAEERVRTRKPHPEIVHIEDAQQYARNIFYSDLTSEEKETIRLALSDVVAESEWFTSFEQLIEQLTSEHPALESGKDTV